MTKKIFRSNECGKCALFFYSANETMGNKLYSTAGAKGIEEQTFGMMIELVFKAKFEPNHPN